MENTNTTKTLWCLGKVIIYFKLETHLLNVTLGKECVIIVQIHLFSEIYCE